MATSTFITSHVRVETAKTFAKVKEDFERQLGKFDPVVLQSLRPDAEQADDVKAGIEAMAGPSAFMLFGTNDHGALLRLADQNRKAVQYVIGNPLFALEMSGPFLPLNCTHLHGVRADRQGL